MKEKASNKSIRLANILKPPSTIKAPKPAQNDPPVANNTKRVKKPDQNPAAAIISKIRSKTASSTLTKAWNIDMEPSTKDKVKYPYLVSYNSNILGIKSTKVNPMNGK